MTRNNIVFRLGLAACLFLCADFAWAVTEQELQADASALLSEHQSLEVDVNGCPNGGCYTAVQIEADVDAATATLDQLVADRATLSGCTCTQLDATIASIELINDTLRTQIADWD
ncbi:MAG: hypothetical protein AAF533_12020 [Acidobacteriota bacterium]